MTLNDIKDKVLSLSPYDTVKCGMDSFDPYIYLDYPEEMRKEIDSLSQEEVDEYDEWESGLLNHLRSNGSWDNYK